MPNNNRAKNENAVQQCQKLFWILFLLIPNHWEHYHTKICGSWEAINCHFNWRRFLNKKWYKRGVIIVSERTINSTNCRVFFSILLKNKAVFKQIAINLQTELKNFQMLSFFGNVECLRLKCGLAAGKILGYFVLIRDYLCVANYPAEIHSKLSWCKIFGRNNFIKDSNSYTLFIVSLKFIVVNISFTKS